MEKKYSDLFAFDLDGTLVHDAPQGGREIPVSLLSKVHDLFEMAHLVVATGRRYRSALKDLTQLPAMPYFVLHNGLLIKDAGGKTIERHELQKEDALHIAGILRKLGVHFFFAADAFDKSLDYVYTEEALKDSKAIQLVHARTPGAGLTLKNISDVLNLEKDIPFLEVCVLDQYENLLALQSRLKSLLPGNFKALVVKNIGVDGWGAMEIFKKECSKWTGIHFVKEKLGARRVIAVGDDENDIEMLREADLGIAMGHAEPQDRKSVV